MSCTHCRVALRPPPEHRLVRDPVDRDLWVLVQGVPARCLDCGAALFATSIPSPDGSRYAAEEPDGYTLRREER